MGWKTAGLIRVSGLTDGSDVDVLEAIATFLNEETGQCFPALESVMSVARKSRNVVRQSIKDLCAQGVLSFSADPGMSRYYVIHLQRLPEPKVDALKKSFAMLRADLMKESAPVQNPTRYRSEPGSEANGEGVQKCTPSGVRSEPGEGSELNPEQGNNRKYKKEENKEVLCALPSAVSATASAPASQAQPPEMSDEEIASLFADAQIEGCPPFPEKGTYLSSPSEKGDHLSTKSEKPKLAYPPCQYEKVVALYHEKCKGLRRVMALTDARKRTINARWRDFCREDKLNTVEEALDSFAWFFGEVASSRFLMGFSNPGPGRDRAFVADFDWLMRPTNFLKVCEGKYVNGSKPQ